MPTLTKVVMTGRRMKSSVGLMSRIFPFEAEMQALSWPGSIPARKPPDCADCRPGLSKARSPAKARPFEP